DVGAVVAGAATVAAGVLDQVADNALEVVGADPRLQARLDGCAQLAAQGFGVAAFAFEQVLQHAGYVDAGLGHLPGRSRVFHQLADAVVDLGQIFVDGLAGLVGHVAHLDFQPDPRQGGAQVVGNPRQHDFAVGLVLPQVARHAVEGDVHVADLDRP